MTRKLLFANPRARSLRREPGRLDYAKTALGHENVLAPDTLPELNAMVQGLPTDEPLHLIVWGGDGTVHQVVNAWYKAHRPDSAQVSWTFLTGGTMNTIAKSLGMTGTPEQQLRDLATASDLSQLPRTRRGLLKLNGSTYGFLFGVGVIEKFIRLHDQAKDPTPLSAGLLLSRMVASSMWNSESSRTFFRPLRAHVTFEGKMWRGSRWLAIGAGTVDDAGLRFRPFFESLQTPGKFHAFGHGGPPTSLAMDLSRARFARHFRGRESKGGVGTHLRITSSKRIPFMMDGERYRGEEKLDLHYGPTLEFVLNSAAKRPDSPLNI